MKKPYLKRDVKIGPFSVWIVNGQYIRKKIDKEFTNFGQHYRFKFIPKNEFWIDEQHGRGSEKHFFIWHLLIENKLMSEGMKYEKAVSEADKAERIERDRSNFILGRKIGFFKKRRILRKIRIKLLKEYSNKKIRTWIVNGKLVRDFFYIDFTEGGHDKVFSFIPKNEIWIDDDLNPSERPFVFLHEIYERNRMEEHRKMRIRDCISQPSKIHIKNYLLAHNAASKIEFHCRNNPRLTEKLIQKELDLALNSN